MTTKLTTADEHWHLSRALGVGGSEVAAVLGVSRWKTALDVYEEKVRWADDPQRELQAIEERDVPEFMYWGKVLEPVIAKQFCKESTLLARPGGCHTHPDYEECRVSIDYELLDRETGEVGVLDCKSANRFRAAEWEEGTPPEVRAQVMWGAGLFGLGAVDGSYTDLANDADIVSPLIDAPVTFGAGAGLLGGNKFVYSEFDHSTDWFDSAVLAVRAFWKRVVDRDPPPAQGRRDLKALAALYPTDDGGIIDLPEEAIELDQQRCASMAQRNRHDNAVKDADARLRELMGTATWGRIPGGKVYRLQVEHKSSFTVKASRSRVLRRQNNPQ